LETFAATILANNMQGVLGVAIYRSHIRAYRGPLPRIKFKVTTELRSGTFCGYSVTLRELLQGPCVPRPSQSTLILNTFMIE
jgi:hypothetical protein